MQRRHKTSQQHLLSNRLQMRQLTLQHQLSQRLLRYQQSSNHNSRLLHAPGEKDPCGLISHLRVASAPPGLGQQMRSLGCIRESSQS